MDKTDIGQSLISYSISNDRVALKGLKHIAQGIALCMKDSFVFHSLSVSRFAE